MNFKLVFVLFFVLSAGQDSWGITPFKRFRLWTNDIGEAIWGFESNCPKKISPKNKTIADAEEWRWLQETSKLHKKNILRNHYHIGQMLMALKYPSDKSMGPPHYPDEITLTEENMIIVGQISREVERLQAQPASNTSCPISIKDCRDAINQRLDRINKRIKLLKAAQQELLLQTPILAHHNFDYLINTVIKGDFPYEQNDKRFRVALEKTLKLNRTIIEERVEKLDMIINHMPYQMNQSDYEEILKDTALIEEIYISLKSTPEIDKLYDAQCRLENRSLKNQGMGELRTLGLDATFAIASLGFSSYISAGRVITSGKILTRAIPLFINEILSSTNDINEIMITENRCQAIQAALLHNKELAELYIDCKKTKSDQITKALISAAGSSLLIHRSLQTRVNRNIVRLFTIDLKTMVHELKTIDLNAAKDLSYNIRDAVKNRKTNRHPENKTK